MHTFLFLYPLFVFDELAFALMAGTWSRRFWKIPLLNVEYAAFFMLPALLFPRGAAFACIVTLFGIWVLIMITQLTYYRIFATFFSLSSLANGGQALQFAGVAVRAFARNLPCLLILCLPPGVFCAVWPMLPETGNSWVGLALICLAVLIKQTVFWRVGSRPLSKFAVALGQGDAPSSVSHWGPLGMMEIDVYFCLFRRDRQGRDRLRAYTDSRPPKRTNDHTGRFKGYNVIYLTAESFSHLAIDRERTPALYKMQREGVYFSECYNPLWGVSTIDGEYVSCTGLLPKAGVWSQMAARENALSFTLGNVSKAAGVPAFAYHNNHHNYYRRDLTHPNMGYAYKGLGGGLEMENVWPQSDLEMVQKSLPEYIGQERFTVYYMTVSGHLPYEYAHNAQVKRHWDKVKHLPYSEGVRAYLATQMELEAALAYLLARGPPKTLFAVVSDHYPYGLTRRQHAELLGRPVAGRMDLYRNAMLLYAPGMTPEAVSGPVYSADMLPTLLNLLDWPHDPRLFSGRDVFSDMPPLVPFADRSFVTGKGRWDSWHKRFTPAPGVEMSREETRAYVRQTLAAVNAKFAAAARVLDYDGFSQ